MKFGFNRQLLSLIRRYGAPRLLWEAFRAEPAPNRGLVVCLPPRFMPNAEKRDSYFAELLSTITADRPDYDQVDGRILLVSSGLGAGGSERQIANTLAALKQRGADVHYVGLWLENVDGNDFHLPAMRSLGVPCQHLPRTVTVERKGLTLLPPALAEALSHLSDEMLELILNLVVAFQEQRPELVHSWLDETNIQVGLAAAIAGVPRVVLSCRSVSPTHFPFHQPYMRPAYRSLMTLPNVTMLNNSHAGAASYATWLDIDQARIRVIHNGLDLSGFTRPPDGELSAFRTSLGIPAEAPVIGSVYRIGAEKRPRLWLDACLKALEAHPDAHFLLVGHGDQRADLETYAETKGVRDRLHLPGVRKDVALALSAMDVLLMTSVAEGLPNVLLEAQWLGVPVVTTRAGGTAETLDQDRTGFVAADDSAEVLGGLLAKVLADDDWRASVTEAGPAFIAAHFGIDRMIEATIAAYGPNNNRAT